MISFKSIFSRIIFLHVIALVITAIVMPVVLYWFFKWAANDLHDQAMREQAQLVAHYLVLGADGSWKLDLPPALEDIYSQAVGRYSYAVVDDTGRVLFSSRKDRSPIFSADPRASNVTYLDTRHGNAAISGVSVAKEMDGHKVWVQVGEDLAHRDVIVDDIVADFFKRVGWITLPVLLFLLAIDIVIFRRALRPLLNASELAKKINPRRTDIRLPPKEMPKEILPLVEAVNQALDRLEAGFRVQREFTADAAHELRTPLTILRSRIDTLADRGISKALHKDIEGMAPQGKNIALSGSEAPVWVSGNAEMLSRAIRNLVENAINHSPPGTTVEIVVEDSGMVRVLDEGPGIKEEERELMFQRFWRRDRRRTGGAGLGLSIVQRIADAHAATISVDNRPTGGATFSLGFVRVG